MNGIRRALVLSASLTLLPALSTAADDPYADYRIPEHYWRSWTATLSANGNHRVGPSPFSIPSTSAGLSGTGTTALTGGLDSDTRSRAYGLFIGLQGSRNSSDREGDEFGTHVDGHVRDQNGFEDFAGFFGLSHFPWAVPLGFSAVANAGVDLNQSWSSSDQVASPSFLVPPTRFHSANNSTFGSYVAFANLNASVGWGRVRDATPVYRVQVLEQRLQDLGTIQRPLSPQARERLAALYTVEFDVAFAHQRPTKYFWGELERLLREDGALQEAGLDAYAVQRLLEPLTIGSSFIARTRGFSVGPLVMLAKNWSHLSTESSSLNEIFVADTLFSSSSMNDPRTETNDQADAIFSGAAIEYHRPYGMRWQLDALSRALLSESGEELSATNVLSVSWLVADRWLFSSRGQWDLVAPGHGLDRHTDQWAVVAGAVMNYFLEDRWAFQIGASHVQRSQSFGYQRSEQFTLGVTYQFSGLLNAPGLFEPMRLSPPTR